MSADDRDADVEYALRCADSQESANWRLAAVVLAGEVRRLRQEKQRALDMMLDSYNAARHADERVVELQDHLRERYDREHPRKENG